MNIVMWEGKSITYETDKWIKEYERRLKELDGGLK